MLQADVPAPATTEGATDRPRSSSKTADPAPEATARGATPVTGAGTQRESTSRQQAQPPLTAAPSQTAVPSTPSQAGSANLGETTQRPQKPGAAALRSMTRCVFALFDTASGRSGLCSVVSCVSYVLVLAACHPTALPVFACTWSLLSLRLSLRQ